MYEMTKLDWGVMALFFVVMIGIGLFTSVLIKNTKDYFTGGGKMPWWLLGVSHHVSGYSAVAFTAYAAIAYTTGFTVYIWWAVPISLACFVGIFCIVSRWSRLRTRYNIESPLEYLSTRYNVPTQQILAWWGVLLKILDVGAKWVAVALVITTFAPKISFTNAVFLSVGLGLFYSTIGGLWAGTLTDFAMFIVQFVSGISMLVVVLARLGGVSAIWTIWDQPALEGHLAPMAGEYGTWSCIIGLFLINLLGYNGGTWNLAQRFIAAPQGSDARKAALLSAALYLIWPLVLFFPMWACPLLLPGLPEDQLKQSYCLMVVKFLPPGLTGLMLAALVSHTLTMTTADATAITSVLVRDVFPKIFPSVKFARPKQQLLIARMVTLVFMLLTTVVALGNENFGGIIGIVIDWFSALLGPVSIAMILGLMPWFRHCGVGATLLALVAGIGIFIVMKFLPHVTPKTFQGFPSWFPAAKAVELSQCLSTKGMTIIIPTVVSFVVYAGVGLVSAIRGQKVPERVDRLLEAISTDEPLSPEYTEEQ
ncbi:MAG: Na+:solute symporter [Thermoguttaceae bacterium]|nr:Na+:solute symporter [Thermoguttaceae bacterium]